MTYMVNDSVKVAKRLFLFIHGLYGGGPCIVENEKFYQREKKYMV